MTVLSHSIEFNLVPPRYFTLYIIDKIKEENSNKLLVKLTSYFYRV